MPLDDDAAYEVFKARDARFDGRLFVGVRTTGIYCRPICRVRTPKRENCRFFDTPAQAEAAAFRPCLKCRPEVAPGPGLAWSVMDASRTLARQAAEWLDRRLGDDETPSIAELATQLGVSDRHLRRVFATTHGVTPLQYLQTRRLLLAKQLLTDTQLPIAQVALASGFRSLRRFNAAFAESYRMNPSRLRAEAEPAAPAAQTSGDAIEVTLGYRAPYDVPAMLRFLAQRAIPGIEMVDDARIRRSLRSGTLADTCGWLEAEFLPDTLARGSSVRLRFAPSLAPHSARVVAAVRRWLDLDAAPHTIDAALIDLPGDPGLRLPGTLDAFELVVRAVLGQQVTVAAARTLACRLVERFGDPLSTPWGDVHRAFPQPQQLAEIEPDRISELGIIRARAGAIQALARSWPTWSQQLGAPRSPEPLIAQLVALPGIGPWTAHYIAMRALGWPDAFPPKDVAVLKAMGLRCGTRTPREAEAHAQRWQPWRAYAVLRLWNSLAASASPAPPTASPALPPSPSSGTPPP